MLQERLTVKDYHSNDLIVLERMDGKIVVAFVQDHLREEVERDCQFGLSDIIKPPGSDHECVQQVNIQPQDNKFLEYYAVHVVKYGFESKLEKFSGK